MNTNFAIKRFILALILCFISQVCAYNKSALEFLKTHQRVRGAKLEDLDFSYANLAGINLANVNLSRANFTEANLTGANLTRANLSEANCLKANLSGANLSSANLTRFKGEACKLINANLSNADLSYSKFSGDASGASFINAILYQIEFCQATLIGANFKAADLAYAKFFLTDIRNANFSDANLTQSDFHAARKRNNEGHMNKGDWDSINFSGADLAGAYMLGCLISKMSLKEKGAINTDLIVR